MQWLTGGEEHLRQRKIIGKAAQNLGEYQQKDKGTQTHTDTHSTAVDILSKLLKPKTNQTSGCKRSKGNLYQRKIPFQQFNENKKKGKQNFKCILLEGETKIKKGKNVFIIEYKNYQRNKS